jgi:hypothetical protein
VAIGVRTRQGKYVQRFSPQEDELYFELPRDPRELADRLAENRERVRPLRALAEAAMVPNPYRHVLRFVGPARYEVELETRAWMQDLEALGLGVGETQQLLEGGRRLRLRLQPRAGAPREVRFVVRPMGASVRLSGTRDGRPLRPEEVFVAEQALHPAQVPLRLPDIESEADHGENMLAPPRTGAPGLHLWLQPLPGHTLLVFDSDARERLKALGYLN